jgi:hypothetical protein
MPETVNGLRGYSGAELLHSQTGCVNLIPTKSGEESDDLRSLRKTFSRKDAKDATK